MIITTDILAERFEEYNKLYFDDELPTPNSVLNVLQGKEKRVGL